MTNIDISVIIPVYNTEKYLPRCLNSLSEIKGLNCELIIVNDASPGNCLKILELYKNSFKKFVYIENKKNKGLLASRCIGINSATGKYILNLDSDDWINPSVYNAALCRANTKKLDVVIFNCIQVNEKNNRWIEENNVLSKQSNLTGINILDNIIRNQCNNWIWHVAWNKLILTKHAKSVTKNINTDSNIVMYEDLLFSITLFVILKDSNRIDTIHDQGVHYYRHDKSVTKNTSNKLIYKKINDINNVFTGINKVLNKYNLFEKYKDDLELCKSYVYTHYREIINNISFSASEQILVNKIKTYINNNCKNKDIFNKQYSLFVNASNQILQNLKKGGHKCINIYGTGLFAKILAEKLTTSGISISCFIQKSPDNSGKFCNLNVISLRDSWKLDTEPIVIASLGSFEEIQESLLSVFRENNRTLQIICHQTNNIKSKICKKLFYFEKEKLINNLDHICDISEYSKSIYFGIPKTGCSTIRRTLQLIELKGDTNLLPDVIHDRTTSPLTGLFSHLKSPEELLNSNNYFTFTFVRNPFSRLLSAYLDKFMLNNWEKKRIMIELQIEPNSDFSFMDFLNVIKKTNVIDQDIHWMPQNCLLPKNVKSIDYIGKFESFDKDWNEILTTLNNRAFSSTKDHIKSQDITWHKTNSDRVLSKYYNKESTELVKELYIEDFKAFNYSVDLPIS